VPKLQRAKGQTHKAETSRQTRAIFFEELKRRSAHHKGRVAGHEGSCSFCWYYLSATTPWRVGAATGCESVPLGRAGRPRRLREMRRRSRSEAPPQTPCSIWFSRAYSKQGDFTGHSAQYRRATSTPTPSLGKNTSGGSSRHRPCTIQEVSKLTSIARGSHAVNRYYVSGLSMVPVVPEVKVTVRGSITALSLLYFTALASVKAGPRPDPRVQAPFLVQLDNNLRVG
jgi:hypothetical protein